MSPKTRCRPKIRIPDVLYYGDDDDEYGLPFFITKVESIRPEDLEPKVKEPGSVKKGGKKKVISSKSYSKPPYSYACLIALALKNSKTGGLPVGGIYKFLCHHFPYFRTASKGWKDQIRSYLKTKYFEKLKTPGYTKRTGNYWTINPSMVKKFHDEILRSAQRNLSRIKSSLVDPENLDKMERGELNMDWLD